MKRLTLDEAIDEIRAAIEDIGDADSIAEILRVVKGGKARVIHPDDDDAEQDQKEPQIEVEDGTN